MRKHSPFTQDYVILIVDDEPQYRAVLRQNLELFSQDIPIAVHEAEDGEGALERLEAGGVDCVLLDHLMPGGNGLEWMKKILERWRDLSVILITGVGNESLAVDALKAGAVDFLVKGSTSPYDLQRALFSALQKSDLRRMLRRQQEEIHESERQRLFVDNVAAACRHMDKHVAVVEKFVELAAKDNLSSGSIAALADARAAVEKMRETIKKIHEDHRENNHNNGKVRKC